jgi:hypothetical protein
MRACDSLICRRANLGVLHITAPSVTSRVASVALPMAYAVCGRNAFARPQPSRAAIPAGWSERRRRRLHTSRAHNCNTYPLVAELVGGLAARGVEARGDASGGAAIVVVLGRASDEGLRVGVPHGHVHELVRHGHTERKHLRTRPRASRPAHPRHPLEGILCLHRGGAPHACTPAPALLTTWCPGPTATSLARRRAHCRAAPSAHVVMTWALDAASTLGTGHHFMRVHDGCPARARP